MATIYGECKLTLKIRTAVILVGGSGLRLRPLTDDRPKCMIILHGNPLLYWTLTWLKNYGFEHVVLGVSYRKEAVINYVKENPFGIKLILVNTLKRAKPEKAFDSP